MLWDYRQATAAADTPDRAWEDKPKPLIHRKYSGAKGGTPRSSADAAFQFFWGQFGANPPRQSARFEPAPLHSKREPGANNGPIVPVPPVGQR